MYKVIDMDISDSVFNYDISALMYIIKDIYTDGYINAIPSILFSCSITSGNDYKYLLELDIMGK